MTTAAAVIAEAKKHLDYVEGKNKDNMFGAWYGMNHVAWCAEFVSYCIAHAGGVALIKGAQSDKGFASCGAGIKFFKSKKAWFKVADAKPGDLCFFDWDHDGSQDHVGIVVSNDPKTKTLHTIEGNTSDTNHSNGGTVEAKVRNYSVIMGVGRPAYAVAAAPVVAPPRADAPVASKPVSVSPVTSGKVYKVVAGDSYWAIAEKHPIKGLATSETVKVLQKLNGNVALHPNDVIKIK
jgi:LysM repeat protein